MHTLLLVCQQTAFQFAILFGAFIGGGLLLTLIAKWMNNVFRQFHWPSFGLYAFGAIGIPIHEFSHAFFCKLFGHEVQDIKWFDPSGKGGSSGAVTHQYNPWNLYQRIGHFFIGFGPAIFGSFLMGLLFYVLIPAGPMTLKTSLSAHEPSAIFILRILRAVFNRANSHSLRFYGFIYLALCISSQIELSPEDLKQGLKGMVPIALTLFVANVIAWAAGAHWHAQVMTTGQRVFSIFAAIFSFSAILAVLCLALSTVIFGILNCVFGRNGVNPFKDSASRSR